MTLTSQQSALANVKQGRDLLAVPVIYRLPFSRIENPPEWRRTEIVATKFDGGKPSQWAIREMQMVMAKDGEWEWEPSPSNRDDDFLSRTRFDAAEDAAECALKFSSSNESSADTAGVAPRHATDGIPPLSAALCYHLAESTQNTRP